MDTDCKFVNICLCCLAEDRVLQNMAEETFEAEKQTIRFLDGYTQCSGIDLTNESEGQTRKSICVACANRLTASYEFRQLCQVSYKLLKDRLELERQEVKEELLSENEDGELNFVYQDFEQQKANESQHFSQVFVRDKSKLAAKLKATPEPLTAADSQSKLKVESDNDSNFNQPIDFEPTPDDSDEDDENKPLARVAASRKKKRPTKKEKRLLNIDVENIEANYFCFYCDTVILTHTEYVKHRENHMADRSSHRLERKCNICGEQVAGYFTHIEEKHRDYRPNFCIICPRGKYQSPNDLKHHLYTHTLVSISRCLSCNKDFKSQNQLRWHIATESHSKELYHCPYCGLGFQQFLSLNSHFTEKHNDINVKKLFPCFTCKKIYVVKKYFLNHECMKNAVVAKKLKKKTLSTSQTKRPSPFKCERCTSEFDNEDEFVCHQLTICEEPPKFVCPTCDKVFETRRSLSRHKATHAEKSRVFICDLCGTSTTSEFKLKLHKVSHETHRPFTCQKCPSTFKTEQHLKNHQDFHKERQYECDLCGKKFRFHHTIKTHMAIHVKKTCTSDLRKFSCDFCERTFVRARDRERHLKMHTDDRPVKCHLCTREFRDNGGLNEHYRRVHEGIYFECNLCGKKYAQRLKLKDHLFVHRGFNPYHCPSCPQQFIKKWLYKRHLLTHNIQYVEKVHGYRETEDLRDILVASIRIPNRNSDNTVQRHHEQSVNVSVENTVQQFQPPDSQNCTFASISQVPPPLLPNHLQQQHQQHDHIPVNNLTMLQNMEIDDKNAATSLIHLQ